MSYEKEFAWEYGQTIAMEYSLGPGELKLDSWRLYKFDTEIIPNREIADEINIMLEEWLKLEYNKNSWNYHIEFQEAMVEKSWEASRDR